MKASLIILAILITFVAPGPTAADEKENGLEESCGKDAREFYRNKFEHGFEKGTTSYRPYYNKKLNICFVSISIHGYRIDKIKVDSIYIVLYDLNAKKELGSFFQAPGDRDDPNPYCTTLAKPVAKCTPADWDAFMQHYLQE